MRVLWGLGFAIVVVLGFVLGLRNCGEAEGAKTAGFLDESSVSAAAPPAAAQTAGLANLPATEPPASTPSVAAPAVASQPALASAPVRPAASRLEEAALAASVLHRPWSEVSVLVSQSVLPDARKRM